MNIEYIGWDKKGPFCPVCLKYPYADGRMFLLSEGDSIECEHCKSEIRLVLAFDRMKFLTVEEKNRPNFFVRIMNWVHRWSLYA